MKRVILLALIFISTLASAQKHTAGMLDLNQSWTGSNQFKDGIGVGAITQSELASLAGLGINFTYCLDCIPTSAPCVGGSGSGSFALYLGGVWTCSFGGGGTPGGTAGGDLSGIYPNPTVISITNVTQGVLKLPQLNNPSPLAYQMPFVNTGATGLSWTGAGTTGCFLGLSGTGPAWDSNLCSTTGSPNNLTYNGTITATKFIGTGPYDLTTPLASGLPSVVAGQSQFAVGTDGFFYCSYNGAAFSLCLGTGTGTVTSIATTSPITGGTITTTGTIACATCVAASSPGVGIAHFAGSTQTVTSSAINLAGADVTGQLPISKVGSAGLSGTSPIQIASTGVISCPTCGTGSGSVSSVTFTGDGTVLSSTPSSAVTTTGTLTASLANAGAGTVFGNNTSSSAAPAYTAAPVLGVDNSAAGTLQLANGSAAAHTILASGATTTNTIKGFTVVPTTGHILDCTTSSTTCTLHDSGLVTANEVNASSPGAGIAHFAGSTQTVTSSAIVGADMTANTVTATQLAAQYSKIRCAGGLGDGLNGVTAGTYVQYTCVNTSGVTWTITGINCWTDNAGSSTLNAANNAGTGLLTGAVTCNATKSGGGAAGTQSATTTLANNDAITFTFVADGTSKQTNWTVSLTQ